MEVALLQDVEKMQRKWVIIMEKSMRKRLPELSQEA
jgi:hypothetical protein